MAVESSPSETSPLLASGNGAPSNGTIPDNVESGHPEEDRKAPPPATQTQLKYIIPAISLGVRLPIFLPFMSDPEAEANDYIGLHVGR